MTLIAALFSTALAAMPTTAFGQEKKPDCDLVQAVLSTRETNNFVYNRGRSTLYDGAQLRGRLDVISYQAVEPAAPKCRNVLAELATSDGLMQPNYFTEECRWELGKPEKRALSIPKELAAPDAPDATIYSYEFKLNVYASIGGIQKDSRFDRLVTKEEEPVTVSYQVAVEAPGCSPPVQARIRRAYKIESTDEYGNSTFKATQDQPPSETRFERAPRDEMRGLKDCEDVVSRTACDMVDLGTVHIPELVRIQMYMPPGTSVHEQAKVLEGVIMKCCPESYTEQMANEIAYVLGWLAPIALTHGQ